MQHILVIPQAGQFEHIAQGGFRLVLHDHRQREVVVTAGQEQQINILALRNQLYPLIMMTDNLVSGPQGEVVPPDALVSIVPMPVTSVQAVIDAGQVDALIQGISATP